MKHLRFPKRLTALFSTLALALAVTGTSATPVRANDDFARLLAGVAAVAIIGTAINKADRHDDRRRYAAPPPPPPRYRHRAAPPRHVYHAPPPPPRAYAHPPRPPVHHHAPRPGHAGPPRGALIR